MRRPLLTVIALALVVGACIPPLEDLENLDAPDTAHSGDAAAADLRTEDDDSDHLDGARQMNDAGVRVDVGKTPFYVGFLSAGEASNVDTPVTQAIQAMGGTLFRIGADSDPPDDESFDLFVVSAEAGIPYPEGDVRFQTRYRSRPVPMVVLHQSVSDNVGLRRQLTQGIDATEFQSTDHPIAAEAGFPGEIVALSSASSGDSACSPELAPEVKEVVVLQDDGNCAAVFAADEGAMLNNGSPAPARRVGFHIHPGSDGDGWTPRGTALFKAAVRWSLGLP